MTSPIRVLVVDDHDLVRAGIARLLADFPELAVVGEAGSAGEAVARTLTLRPDVILMDVNMPVEDGIAATRRIRQEQPDTRVIMLTMHGGDQDVFDAIRAGAHGYLLKDASAEEVVSAIKAVAGDGAVITPRLARRLLDELAHQPPAVEPAKTHALDDLSAREVEILTLIAGGESSRSIARRLYLSENTIKHHTSTIFQKLHVHHRSQAAVEAVRRGLIPALPGVAPADDDP